MSSEPRWDLSIVMPCYNEQDCIERVVREWTAEVSPRVPSLELIVVDDGSSDATGATLDRLASEIAQLRVIHQQNTGHGPALRRGLEAARGQWVFHVDSDDQFDSNDFWKLWDHRTEYDYLCGRRTERQDTLHRRVISALARLLSRVAFGIDLPDANIPFKLIRRAALERVLALVPRGVFAPSIMMSLVAKRTLRFLQLPVTHRPRRTGKVSLAGPRLLRICLRCAAELVSFRGVLK